MKHCRVPPTRAKTGELLDAAQGVERIAAEEVLCAVDGPALESFLTAVPACEQRLAGYKQDGNRLLFDAVDHELDKIAAGI